MKRAALAALLICGDSVCTANTQPKLSPKWEELTAPDFRQAIQQSKGTCLLPFGILEKHGQHLPLGTDLLNVRYATLHAVQQIAELQKFFSGFCGVVPPSAPALRQRADRRQ